MWNKKKTPRKRSHSARGGGVGKDNWKKVFFRRHNLPVMTQISPRHVTHNMMARANTALQYTEKLLREEILRLLITRRNFPPFFFFSLHCIYMVRWVLAGPTVYSFHNRYKSNHDALRLKLVHR